MSDIKYNIYTYAIKILGRQDYSAFKLRQKLKSKKFSSEEISAVIETLKQKNYLREAEYCRARLKFFFKKGNTPKQCIELIKRENIDLEEHLIASIIDEIVDENTLDSTDQLDQILLKKGRALKLSHGTKIDKKTIHKLASVAIRKGHSLDSIFKRVKVLFGPNEQVSADDSDY